MTKQTLAVVTMVYDEAALLPVWLRHYGRQVGLANCFVLDHGSADGTTALAAVANLVRLPRSPLDEVRRAALVSGFCNDLLGRYDAVAYTDVDEMLVADPAAWPDLPAYARSRPNDVVTSFGMDVLQVDGEPPLDLAVPVLRQRGWARPFSSLCKPTFVTRPVTWGMGFHYADAPSRLGTLFLFHLAYADFALLEARQRKRVGTPRVGEGGGHHSIPADEMVRHIREDYTRLPRLEDVTLAADDAHRIAFEQRLFREGATFGGEGLIGGNIQSDTLWRVPERFRESV